MRNLLALLLAVVLVLVAVGPLQATDQHRQGQPVPMFAQADRLPQGPGPGRMKGGKMGWNEGRHVEQLRMLKMLELMGS